MSIGNKLDEKKTSEVNSVQFTLRRNNHDDCALTLIYLFKITFIMFTKKKKKKTTSKINIKRVLVKYITP